MKRKMSITRWLGPVMLAVIFAGYAVSAGASHLNVPLHFGMAHPVVDEFGRLLPGTAAQPGALVQILSAEHGVFPPEPNGEPHPDNPVLAEVRIGMGTDFGAGPMGKAAGSITINRYQANKLFARVFNRASTADASFYTDSPVFTNSTASYEVFRIAAISTDQPLDTGDDDGDGLINSWERSLGTDPYLADTDGDGISDYHEWLAGTDALDDADFLRMFEIIPQANGSLLVRWDAVSGKSYQLQQSVQDLTGTGDGFVNVNDPVIATGERAETVVTNPAPAAVQHFRVILLP
ncbi:MAG TPA: thrombospondin type 3 repeat-containing protein [Kiritimatiellia bacterium]|nr:thrombospondin type 3 repeat-containing protein [Kiritimatiellia bacterium]HMO99699.1 thrombospondin type 3 repeat-containing protein [Kiritimatiellia bacterium]